MLEHPKSADRHWSIAVFAARETAVELMETLTAIVSAATRPAVVDLLINGNEELAHAIAQSIASMPTDFSDSPIRVWFIALGDKAHAWNQYIHLIQPDGEMVYFVDGYVRPNQNALALLESCVLASQEALGGTGVPTSGRSARQLRKEMMAHGGIHGNLYCLKQETIKRLVASGFKLPLGIYRTDATLGAALMFNLDPARYDWSPSRICVHPTASWSTRKRHWWHLADVKSQLKRRARQAQGVFENRAVHQFFAVNRGSIGDLPATARELVISWNEHCPDEANALTNRNPLYRYALRDLTIPRDWRAGHIEPRLLRA